MNIGSLVLSFDTGATTIQYPYVFAGMGFDGCVDASGYRGVTFNVSGTLSAGCTISFSSIDKEHNTPAYGGTCVPSATTGCYTSGKVFDLPATSTDVTIDFVAQTGGGTGVATGAAVVDPTQLIALEWLVVPPAAGCTGTVTIDNVTFE